MNFAKFLRTSFFTELLRWLLLLLDKITKHKKMKTRELKERIFDKKSKRNRVSCIEIYVVVFDFLSRSVKVGKW